MDHVMLFAILSACGLLAAGLALRASVWWLKALYIPAAAVAGILGFACVQAGLHASPPRVAGMVGAIARELGSWPTWLIAVVFAGLLLERPAPRSFRQALRRGARSGVLAWILILGQIIIGLAVYVVAVRPGMPGVPASFGQLLEVSWAGGHGSSAAMGEVYKSVGFAQGKDLAFFLATVGLIYGVISGLVLVNLAIRRGWTAAGHAGGIPIVSGLEASRSPTPAAFARTRGEVLEPLVLQVIILAAAFAAGYLLREAFIGGVGLVLQKAAPDAVKYLGNMPLFLFTLLGGWFVRQAMTGLGLADLIDSASIQRLLGVAMEFLIVAAVSTMRMEALATFWVPVTLLLLLAAAWTAFCLMVLARRLLPRAYWFELGLLNYGFATANTPQGFMLLRIIDPELKSGAAEDYAIAAPLSAPFVGGGVITFVVLPQVLEKVPAAWVAVVLGALAVGLYAIGRRVLYEPAPRAAHVDAAPPV